MTHMAKSIVGVLLVASVAACLVGQVTTQVTVTRATVDRPPPPRVEREVAPGVLFLVEPVVAEEDICLGFKVELINTLEDKYVALKYLYTSDAWLLYLYGHDGGILSPLREAVKFDKRFGEQLADAEAETNIGIENVGSVIAPMSSHSWFVPLTDKIRRDPGLLTNKGNLMDRPAGCYEANIDDHLSFAVVSRAELSKAKYQEVSLKTPKMKIKTGAPGERVNLAEVYVRSKSGGK